MQESGKQVAAADHDRARAEGATDIEIHDTVLIAAAFSMFNRYVDGLATWSPDNDNDVRRDGPAAGDAGLCQLADYAASLTRG